MGKSVKSKLGIPPDISRYGYLVGTAGFEFLEWVGLFYPQKSTMAERLDIYQAYFSFLEVSCYLDDPQREGFAELARSFTGKIECSVRVPKSIASPKVWNSAIGGKLLDQMIGAVYPLVEAGRLYSLVFPVDEKTIRSEKRLEYLIDIAERANKVRIDVHIEFRHRSWHKLWVLETLKAHNIGICNLELPMDSAFPLKYYATSEKGYVKYCGRNRKAWNAVERRRGSKEECFDYDYSTTDMSAMVDGQFELGKKVGTAAVVFGNVVGALAVGNAVQCMLLLNHRIEMGKMLKRTSNRDVLGAKSVKIT